MNEGKMTPAGIARLPPEVLRVWEKHRPPVVITDRSGGINPQWEIRFSDGKDYLSKVKMPALAP